jgi:hypothetical protein
MTAKRRLRKDEILLPPIHANAGIEAAYRRKLKALIERLQTFPQGTMARLMGVGMPPPALPSPPAPAAPPA